ncbi:MAG TPA: PilN domain-containing protein [Gammaproteobacteria bacterium]|nr:PilN domain-containing protein [Gammaproteobacteria bacterium]HET7587060.1 PilN domain-containing protein [Gammaproteobacteria bacterium]
MIQQINLYQPILRKPQKVFSARTMSQALAIIAGALILLYSWGIWQTHQLNGRIAMLQAQQRHENEVLEKLEATLAARQPSAALSQALAAAEHERDAKQALLKALSAPHRVNTAGFASVLEGLARTSVPGLWLTRIALANGGDDISLVGATTRSAQVPELVHKLAAAPAFSGVEFKQLEIRRDDDQAHGRAQLDFLLSTTALKGDKSCGNDCNRP